MKKLVLGLAIGVAAVCLYKKLDNEGYFDDECDKAHQFLSKSRRKLRNIVDSGVNNAEYLRERAEYTARKGKEKLDDMID